MSGIFTFTDHIRKCTRNLNQFPRHKDFPHREQTTYTVNNQGGSSKLGNSSANIFGRGEYNEIFLEGGNIMKYFWEGNIRDYFWEGEYKLVFWVGQI